MALQQGDMWDAHKDMLMATLGSAAWTWFYARENRLQAPIPVYAQPDLDR
jgi:uncharacterized membrane protein YjdF